MLCGLVTGPHGYMGVGGLTGGLDQGWDGLVTPSTSIWDLSIFRGVFLLPRLLEWSYGRLAKNPGMWWAGKELMDA